MTASDTDDTIFALSSGHPPAAIAVMRLSGPTALEAARAMTSRDLPQPRRAAFRRFIDPQSGEILDEGLLICFPGPNTETGEDMAEIHAHGSRAVIRGLEKALGRLPGLRLAGPGEFTRRAFVNGKADLASIEGLGDLLAAETASQRRAAMAMMGGGLSRRVEQWTQMLRRLAAQVEAQLDFSDEGDVAATGLGVLSGSCGALARAMDAELAKPSADRLRDGVRVAIGGPPNAGKSSLFNRLAGRDAAIVSSIAGTTRDVIEASIAIGGVPMLLSDSAGIREETADPIEQIGVSRAEALLSGADIILWLGAPKDCPAVDGHVIQLDPKADLDGTPLGPPALHISCVTGQGVDILVETLIAVANTLLPSPGDYALSSRQRDAIARSARALHDASALQDEILVGECLRVALAGLDEITGRTTTEAVLDELFSGFCIGK